MVIPISILCKLTCSVDGKVSDVKEMTLGRLPPGAAPWARGELSMASACLLAMLLNSHPLAGLRLAGHHGVLVVLPVSHAEPQFVVHQALVQRGLARLVPLQDLRGLSHLFRPDGQFFIHFVQFITPFCPLSQGAVVSVLSGFLEVNLSVIADAMPPLLSRRGLGIS